MARFNVYPNENGKWTNDNETSSKTLARSGSSLSNLSNSSLHCVRSSASGGSTFDSIIGSLKNRADQAGSLVGIDSLSSSISNMAGSIENAFENKINSSVQNKIRSVINKNANKIKVNVGDVENMLHLSESGLTQKLASKIIPYDNITSSINGVINNASRFISSKANIKNISKTVSNAFSSISGAVANGISKEGK